MLEDGWVEPATSITGRIYRKKNFDPAEPYAEIVVTGVFSGEITLQDHRNFSETLSCPPDVLEGPDSSYELVGFVGQESKVTESARAEIDALQRKLHNMAAMSE